VIVVAALAVAVFAAPASAQEEPATRDESPSKIYYGGAITLGFGSAFRIGLFPLVGVRLTPKLSVGAQAGIEYANYDGPGRETANYGGALFARYRVIPQLYLHGEGRYASYELFRLGAVCASRGGGRLLGWTCRSVAWRTTAPQHVSPQRTAAPASWGT
jgi:hypothetical protein